MKEAFLKYQDVTVMINFASFRSVYDSVMEALDYAGRLKTIGLPKGGTLDHHRPIHRGSAAAARRRSQEKSIIDPNARGKRGLTTRWITLITSRDGKRRRMTRAKLTPTRSRERGRSSGSIGRKVA